MTLILIILILAISAFISYRTGIFSPASITGLFSSFSISAFYWIVYLGGAQAMTGQGLSFEMGDYREVAPLVASIYLFLVTLTAIAVIGLKKGSSQPSVMQQAMTFQLDIFMNKVALPVTAIGLFLLTALHFILTAGGIGRNPFVDILGQAAGPMCIFTACLMVYCWKPENVSYLTLTLGVFIYNFLLLFVFYSRFTALTIAIITVIFIAKRVEAKRPPISFGVILGFVVTTFLFIYSLEGRSSRVIGQGADFFHVDWKAAFHHLNTMDFSSDSFDSLGTNLFQGPLILAEALRMHWLTFSPKYEYLSFSPAPGFLDGWKRVVGDQMRINQNTPLNAFGELYFFGAPYIALFSAIYMASIRAMTKIYTQVGAVSGLILMSPCMYALFYLHQYPLRNSLRLLYFTTAALLYLHRVLAKKASAALVSYQRRRAVQPIVKQQVAA